MEINNAGLTRTILYGIKEIHNGSKIFNTEVTRAVFPLLAGIRIDELELITKRLLEISLFEQKLVKYQIYFNEFYGPREIIPEHEALQYHIHSFLSDVYAYRERLCRFFGYLKHQIPKENNSDREALASIIEKIKTQFKPIVDIRDDHTHGGKDNPGFGYHLEGAAVDFDSLIQFENFLKSDAVKDTVNWEYANESLEAEKRVLLAKLNEAKQKWIEQSAQCTQWRAATSNLVDGCKELIYQTCGITDAAHKLEEYINTKTEEAPQEQTSDCAI